VEDKPKDAYTCQGLWSQRGGIHRQVLERN
jgi:hypothetical protein